VEAKELGSLGAGLSGHNFIQELLALTPTNTIFKLNVSLIDMTLLSKSSSVWSF
jgi:hypothetical protein